MTSTSHLPTHAPTVSNGLPCAAEEGAVCHSRTEIARTDLDEFVLDAAEPLERGRFPNPPNKPTQSVAPTIPNIQHLLDRNDITARYNEVKKKLVVTLPGRCGSPDNQDNVAMTQIVSLATLSGISVGQIPAIVEAIGDRFRFNPVEDWIRSCEWDGTDRLPGIYATLVEREGFPNGLKHQLIYRWLLSAVAAALKPSGFHCRGVLTLQGPQGIGKTRWTNSLVPDPAMAKDLIKLDHHLDPSDKDSRLSAITHWIVEIGELDGSLRKDIARLKGFLTADQDKVRRPYARCDAEYQRRTVFCATVNDANFLVDPTGNKRWWTLPLASINFQHGIDMQQLFAQLALDFHAGVQWWLTPEEEALLDQQNKAYESVSALRERVLDQFDLDRMGADKLKAMSCIELLKHIGIENPNNAQCKECGMLLREYLGEPKRIQGRDRWRIPLRQHEIDDLNIC